MPDPIHVRDLLQPPIDRLEARLLSLVPPTVVDEAMAPIREFFADFPFEEIDAAIATLDQTKVREILHLPPPASPDHVSGEGKLGKMG